MNEELKGKTRNKTEQKQTQEVQRKRTGTRGGGGEELDLP